MRTEQRCPTGLLFQTRGKRYGLDMFARRPIRRLPVLLFVALLAGCMASPPPPPNPAGVPVVDRGKVEQAVRHYLRWAYSARSVEQLRMTFDKPQEADGKATDLVVHARYAFSSRQAPGRQTLTWGDERLRLQATDRGYRVLR